MWYWIPVVVLTPYTSDLFGGWTAVGVVIGLMGGSDAKLDRGQKLAGQTYSTAVLYILPCAPVPTTRLRQLHGADGRAASGRSCSPRVVETHGGPRPFSFEQC